MYFLFRSIDESVFQISVVPKKKRVAEETPVVSKRRTLHRSVQGRTSRGTIRGRAKKQNPREKKIIRDFVLGKQKTRGKITKDEIIELSNKMGRKKELVMVWIRTERKSKQLDTLSCLLSEKFTIEGTKKNYIMGCGKYCEREYGPHEILCPNCQLFKYHFKCIQKEFYQMEILPPSDYMKEYWSCPHCIRKEQSNMVQTFV